MCPPLQRAETRLYSSVTRIGREPADATPLARKRRTLPTERTSSTRPSPAAAAAAEAEESTSCCSLARSKTPQGGGALGSSFVGRRGHFKAPESGPISPDRSSKNQSCQLSRIRKQILSGGEGERKYKPPAEPMSLRARDMSRRKAARRACSHPSRLVRYFGSSTGADSYLEMSGLCKGKTPNFSTRRV